MLLFLIANEMRKFSCAYSAVKPAYPYPPLLKLSDRRLWTVRNVRLDMSGNGASRGKTMRPQRKPIRTRTIFAIALLAAALAPPVHASGFKLVHSFCKKLNCGDGVAPQQAVAIDQAGNLYGTAQGGAHGQGIVFELVTPGSGRRWQYKVLYHFCALSNCADGKDPSNSTLVVDNAGNVYGTTYGGGAGNDAGTVFELSPPTKGHHWKLHTLYNFCAGVSSCHDGENPNGGLTYAGREAGLAYDGMSPLYGVTASGGGHFGGVAFSLSRNQRGHWVEHVLYAFCQQGGQSCTDGNSPYGRLTMDSSGNLYGTTTLGGANNVGGAFELSAQESGGKMIETVLYDFDAAYLEVVSGLRLDSSGNLFGFGPNGGNSAHCPNRFGCGTAFEISADRTFSVLYNFCELQNCVDGAGPLNRGGTYIDGLGNLFGTTAEGGKSNEGIIFELNGDNVQVLHNFCLQTGCIDGAFPSGGLARDLTGNFFGTTEFGGAYSASGGGGGSVFELSP
jgi:uncharacterized repeat protein (TIGR03803 family)